MNRLNQALLSGCFIVAILLGLCTLRFIAKLDERLDWASSQASATSAELNATLQDAQAVLTSLRGTTESVRRSAVSQLGYYEAIGRRSSLLLGETTILIRHVDEHLAQVTDSSRQLMRQSQESAHLAGASLEETSQAAMQALRSIASLTFAAQNRLQDPAIAATIENLNDASAHLANSAATSEETLNSLRDIIAPTRKGFWRRLLEAVIPRAGRSSESASPSR
jgi:ABC-type transporter Mla subunit MlaD